MDSWFYAYLRLKNARENGTRFTINLDENSETIEAFLAHMIRGTKGRTRADLVAHLERCLEAVSLVIKSLDDPSDRSTCYFIGVQDTLQILLSSLKKR